MRTLKLTCCILFAVINLNAQNLRWLTNVGSFGDDGFWQGQITIDNNDNVVLVAGFGDSILLGANYIQGSQLIKFDSSGQFLWNTPLPSNLFCFCQPAIVTDNLNNIYIASDSLRKYNSSGTLIAAAALPLITNFPLCSFFYGSFNLGVDIFQNVYMTGWYDDNSLRVAANQPALKGCSSIAYLMKFDSSLQLGWKIEDDTNYRFAGLNLLPGINGDMFAGNAGYMGRFDSTGAILGTIVIPSTTDFGFLKYNLTGNIVSNDAMNSISILDTSLNLISNKAIPFANAYPNSFEIVDDSTYVFGSSFAGTVILSNPFQQFYISHGVGWSYDFLLAYFDTVCNMTSAIQLGNAANEQIQFKKFSNGDLLIAGNYGKAADGTTTYFDFGSNHLQSNGGYDFFLARTSPHYSYLMPGNNYALKEIEFFPNPSSTDLKFSIADSKIKITGVEIFDVTGKAVLAKKEINLKEISVTHLPAGIYIVKITAGEKVFYRKFAKE